MTELSELAKLRLDTQAFCRELQLRHRWQLLLIVDYWPVLYFRVVEYLLRKNSLVSRCWRLLLAPLRPFVQGLSGSRIYQGASIGGGLFLHHSNGVVIADSAVLGDNCLVSTGCCIVHRADGSGRKGPRIGNNVRLMVGCALIGPVTVGSNVTIGAHAVVLQDVPDNSVAVGVPARILPAK